MRHRLCGALNRDGSRCAAFPVRGSRRCKWHGGMSCGPVTPGGKLRCYWAGIGAWRAAGGRPHRGPNRTPAERDRLKAAKLQRRVAWLERKERKARKVEQRCIREKVSSGVPLWSDDELGNL